MAPIIYFPLTFIKPHNLIQVGGYTIQVGLLR